MGSKCNIASSCFHFSVILQGKLQRSIQRFRNSNLQEKLQLVASAEEILQELLSQSKLDGDALCSLLRRCAGWLLAPCKKQRKGLEGSESGEVHANLQSRIRKIVISVLNHLDLSDAETSLAVQDALTYMQQLLGQIDDEFLGSPSRTARQWRQLRELLAVQQREPKEQGVAKEHLQVGSQNFKDVQRKPFEKTDWASAAEGVYRPNKRVSLGLCPVL